MPSAQVIGISMLGELSIHRPVIACLQSQTLLEAYILVIPSMQLQD